MLQNRSLSDAGKKSSTVHKVQDMVMTESSTGGGRVPAEASEPVEWEKGKKICRHLHNYPSSWSECTSSAADSRIHWLKALSPASGIRTS